LNTQQKEIDLIKDILKGDKRAFRVLYKNYVKAFLLICLRYIQEKADAEDVLQDAFVKIYRALHSYNYAKGSFYTWSKRIIINECLQHLRKKKRAAQIELDHELENVVPMHFDSEEKLSLQELTEMIQKLPKGYRTIFNLYVVDGFQHREIAEMMNIPESPSKTQLYKAKKMLQMQIKKKETKIKSRYA